MFVPLNPGYTRKRKNNAFTPVNGMISGALQALADSILHPVILLSAVTALLNGSNVQIAAFTVIALASWTISAVIMTSLHHLVRRSGAVVLGAGAVRLLAIAFLTVTAFRSPGQPPQDVIRALLIGFFIYQVSSAVLGRASVRSIAGSSPSAVCAIIFRQRGIIGAIIAMIGGAVVWSVNRSVIDIREAIGVLFILAALSVAAATWFLFAMPGTKRTRRPEDKAAMLSSGLFRPFRTRSYRTFFLFRVALGLAAAADPFIIVFGLRRVGVELDDIGLAVVAYAIGHLAGILIWPHWSPHQNARAPLQVAALLRVLALVITIGIPAIVASTLYTDRFASPEPAARLFLAQYILIGLAVSAHGWANQRYLQDISTPDSTHQAVMTTNVVHGILAFAPFLAALLIDRTSLDEMLWVATAVAFIALLISGFLTESRVFVVRRTGTRSRQRRLNSA